MKKITLLLTLVLSALCGQYAFAEGKTSFPIELSSTNGLPGTFDGNNYVWTSPVYELEAPINGVRITFFESQGNTVSYNGFPVVALAEIKLFDGNGTQIQYTVDNVSTNSLANNDGALEYICDGDVNTHYHSTWSTGTEPNEYVYMDIEFPAEMSSFQYVQVSRNNNALMPSKISITPIGETGNITFVGAVSDSITWSLDLKNGELNIEGTGAMPDYDYWNSVPWYNKRSIIKKVVIGEGVTNIGNYSFGDCSNLKEVEFSSTVTRIGKYAFYNCHALSTVVLGDAVAKIDDEAFYDCDALKRVVFGAGVNEITESAFAYCDNLRILASNATVPPVIKSSTFNGTPISMVYVPSGNGADYSAANYWNNFLIIDGEGVAVEIVLTEAGTLGEKVLEQVEYLSIVNKLKVAGPINDDDLYDIKNRMSNLVEIDLAGAEREYLQDDFFSGRSKIRKVTLPESLRWIANDMFYNCYVLEEVNFPATLQSIGSYAFYNCDNLKTAVIPEGVTDVLSHAFYGCDALESVSLPSTLPVVRNSAFAYCKSLKNVEFSAGLTTIENNAFNNCTSIETLEMPSTLKVIGESAFRYCSSLKSVLLNEGLADLKYASFANCDGLREVVLPSTLMVCDRVFYGCNNLLKIVSMSLLPPFLNGGYSIFDGNSMANRVLYVPALTVNKYKLARGWDAFSKIEGINALPQNIYIHSEEYLAWPDGLNVAYKPNISLDCIYIDYNNRYGSLVVDGNATISIGKFSMLYHPSYYYDYSNNSTGYSALVNSATVRADEVNIELSVKTNKWNFISFPFDVKVSEIVPLLPNTNYVIRKYSGEARANADFDNTWQNMTVDSVLHAGEGYILQCSRYDNNGYSQSYSDFEIKAVNNANKNRVFANSDVVVALNEYLSEFGHNRSWNLVGNPYPCFYDTRYMDFTAPITVWSERNNTYNAYSPVDDEFILRPGEAFFVQRPVDAEGILFASEGRQVNGIVRQMPAQVSGASRSSSARQVFNLVLSHDGVSDRTRFVINENASSGYEASCDASKFLSSDVTVPQIYTVEDDVIFAINERPLGNGVVKLGAYFGNKGDYTISIGDECGSKIILLDKFTGIETDLNTASYSFNSAAGTFDNRFEIRVNSGLTQVDNTVYNEPQVYVNGNDIVVVAPVATDIAIYSADGRLVSDAKAAKVQVAVAAGVYVVKVAGKVYKVAVAQ